MTVTTAVTLSDSHDGRDPQPVAACAASVRVEAETLVPPASARDSRASLLVLLLRGEPSQLRGGARWPVVPGGLCCQWLAVPSGLQYSAFSLV